MIHLRACFSLSFYVILLVSDSQSRRRHNQKSPPEVTSACATAFCPRTTPATHDQHILHFIDDTTMAASPPMPPSTADLATTWAFLEEGVDHIMTKLQTGVSYSKYMSLYTVAYNYCTSSRMHGTSEAVGTGSRSKSPGCKA
jgi:hypothetical protein